MVTLFSPLNQFLWATISQNWCVCLLFIEFKLLLKKNSTWSYWNVVSMCIPTKPFQIGGSVGFQKIQTPLFRGFSANFSAAGVVPGFTVT
jgi:hypothetical protein